MGEAGRIVFQDKRWNVRGGWKRSCYVYVVCSTRERSDTLDFQIIVRKAHGPGV